MTFDPHRTLWTFSEEGGRLRRSLAEREVSGRPIGNYAYHDLGDVICAWLVGLHGEIALVLPRALRWLDEAIENNENFGQDQNFHRVTLRKARAMGLWMRSAVNAPEDWAEAAKSIVAYWSSGQWGYTPAKIVRDVLDDYMAFSVQAGRYGEAIETYERLVGKRKTGMSKKPTPREYAYAVCIHQEHGEFGEEAVFEAGRKMLQASLEENWLGMGQALRAATWLKIVYWDRDARAGRPSALTPLQTVLKAYENMPRVQWASS